MNELTSTADLDAAFGESPAILFKHNPDCPISANVHREMESFLSGGARVPVYRIDIHANRDVSDHVAERTGVTHESPQVIVLRDGRAAYHADRWDVSADALREQVGIAPRG